MSLDTLFAMLTNTQLRPWEDASLTQGADANLDESKTYNWDGARMTADVGGAIPVVYGTHLVPPNVINLFVEAGENETLNMLLAVCEGEIDGISNIKLNGNPIENYFGEAANDPYGENAEITIRKGQVNQAQIENFGDLHSLNPVGQTLSKGEPFVYTTQKIDCEAFNLEFKVNRLFQVDPNENQLAWYVAIQVEYRKVGDIDWTYAGVHEFRKNTTSSFKRYFKSDYLTPAQYEIKVTRVSDNSDATHIGEVFFNSVDEITTQDLIYPSTALLGIRLVASEKVAEALPNVTCVVRGLKVKIPDVRDALGNPVDWEDYYYDGGANQFKMLSNDSVLVWDGSYVKAYSGNPVWCLRDFLLNERYGLGDFVKEENLDEASFLAVAKYCDEGVPDLNGKKEKRMKLDLVFDTKEDALDILYRICNTFRGLLSIVSGRIRLLVEKQQDPVFLFTMGNIIKESFGISYVSSRSIPNVLQIQFSDKDKNFSMDTLEVADEGSIASGEEIKRQTVQLLGCTRMSQALREGKILLNKLKLNVTQIGFKAGWDGLTLQPGDVFEFQHDLTAWGEGGRVRSSSTSSLIRLDKEVVLEMGKTYEIEIKNKKDQIEKRTISSMAGSYTEVEVESPFSFVPEEYDIWNLGVQNYLNREYRILSLNRNPNGVADITAVEYHDEAYDYTGIQIPEEDFSYLTLEIPNVSDLTGEEKVTRLPDGSIDDVVNISFTKPPTGARWVKKVTRFEIYISDDNGISWNFFADTDKEFFVVKRPFTKGTRYTFAVVSVTEEGEKKVPANSPQVIVEIKGWMKPPSNVVNFIYTFEDEIKLVWDKVQDEDLAGYEIRKNKYNWGINDEDFVWRGRAESYTIVRPEAREGITYYIKAFNTSGVFSNEVTIVTPLNPAPSALALSFTPIFQKAFLMWQDSPDVDLVEYEVWENNESLFMGYEHDSERLIHKAKGTSAVMIPQYNPTFYRIRGVDKFGPGEWSNYVEVPQIRLTSGDIGVDQIKEVHISDNSITAPKILTGQIQAGHIAAMAITAEKINVARLSAISANLGYIKAGTIVGTLIKTSEDLFRTELNSAGLFGYDNNGNLTVKLSSGELCLINPEDSGFYSFLDHGALKFKHPYGEVPYAKRITSGSLPAGSTLTLCQWYEKPEVSVGIRRLTTYDAVQSASSQELCVYANNYRFYDNGGGDFGWKVDLHSKLVLSGGTRTECIYLANFDVTQTTLGNTCQVLVKEMFQLFCHGCSPDTFKYGISSYEVRYRRQGSGVWCACCYEYIQPHATITEMKTTNIECQTITFPSPADVWEVQIHENSFEWRNSGIVSGYYCCYLCCYYYPADASYWFSADVYGSKKSWNFKIGHGGLFTTNHQTFPVYSDFGTSPYLVCYSKVSYIASGKLEARVTHSRNSASASVAGEFGGSASVSAGGYYIRDWWKYQSYDICGGKEGRDWVNRVRFDIDLMVQVGHFASYDCAVGTGETLDVIQRICAKCCKTVQLLCCYWYCIWTGDPETCEYKKFYSMQEVAGGECILDAAGEINYLAISYA